LNSINVFTKLLFYLLHSVKPVLRGHLWDKEKVAFIRQVTS